MASVFRPRFEPNFAGTINWFPGHMAKATRLIGESLKGVDVALEIRDARIPFSSRNFNLEKLLKSRNTPHVIVFHKADLANHNLQQKLCTHFLKENRTAIFTSVTSKSKAWSVNQIIPTVLKVAAEKLSRQLSERKQITVMVLGVPNVGKSTIINNLRMLYKATDPTKVVSFSPAKVAPLPGVTRALSAFKVSENPLAFLIDSPGIMVPRVEDIETGLKLALTGAIKDSRLGQEVLADYLLYIMNKMSFFGYTKVFGLAEPNDNIHEVLQAVSKFMGVAKQGTEFDPESSAAHFVRAYRSGELGTFTLDSCRDI